MNDKFARYIAPAADRAGGLLLIGAVLFLLMSYLGLSVGMLGLFALLRVDGDLALIDIGFAEVGSDLSEADVPAEVIALLLTFVAMAAAVLLTARLFHDRGLRSLLGWRPALPLARTTLVVALPILLLVCIGGMLFSGPRPNIDPLTWLAWMPVALPLLLIQVSSEELIFRGYLMQELAARYQARWIWMGLPAVVFGLLHFDPDTHGTNALLVVASTTIFGLIAADVTVRTGSLIPAIILHFLNNLWAMMILSLDGTITGLALFVTAVNASDETAVRTYLLIDIALMLMLWLVWMAIASRRAQLQSTPARPM